MLNLIIGDFYRLFKYKIYIALILGYIVLALVLKFLYFLPTHILIWSTVIDLGITSGIIISASILYEKEEHTIHSVLLSPIGIYQYTISKIIVLFSLNIMSALIFAITLRYLGHSIKLIWLLLIVLISTEFHTILAMALTLFVKKFTDIIIYLILYAAIVGVPMALLFFNVIKPSIYLLLSPIYGLYVLSQVGYIDTNIFHVLISIVIIFSVELFVYYGIIKNKIYESLAY